MKQLSEVIHLYYYADCRYKNEFGTYQDTVAGQLARGNYKIKPILIRLGNLTFEHAILLDAEFFTLNYEDKSIVVESFAIDKLKLTISDVTTLLRLKYDLFDLIPNGYAIDAKTLK